MIAMLTFLVLSSTYNYVNAYCELDPEEEISGSLSRAKRNCIAINSHNNAENNCNPPCKWTPTTLPQLEQDLTDIEARIRGLSAIKKKSHPKKLELKRLQKEESGLKIAIKRMEPVKTKSIGKKKSTGKRKKLTKWDICRKITTDRTGWMYDPDWYGNTKFKRDPTRPGVGYKNYAMWVRVQGPGSSFQWKKGKRLRDGTKIYGELHYHPTNMKVNKLRFTVAPPGVKAAWCEPPADYDSGIYQWGLTFVPKPARAKTEIYGDVLDINKLNDYYSGVDSLTESDLNDRLIDYYSEYDYYH